MYEAAIQPQLNSCAQHGQQLVALPLHATCFSLFAAGEVAGSLQAGYSPPAESSLGPRPLSAGTKPCHLRAGATGMLKECFCPLLSSGV